MDLKSLPSELVQEILDRVPFSEWLGSIIFVCKEWKKLCESSRSQSPNRCFIINTDVVTAKQHVKLDTVRDIVSKYQVTGLDLSGAMEAPSVDVLTASKQLKWLTLSIGSLNNTLKAPEQLDNEILSLERGHNWWRFNRDEFKAAEFFNNFPKVRVFSIYQLFTWAYTPPILDVPNAPPNTEILQTSAEYYPEYIYGFLDAIAKGLPRLKKLVLNLLNSFKNKPIEEVIKMYETLESYMEKNYGVQLVVRDPYVLVQHLDLFKEALDKNGFPYEYYTPHLKQTLFSHACVKEALDTMKYLIDSGITTLEKELKFDPRTLTAHQRMHFDHYNTVPPFFVVPENFVDLETNEAHRAIADYLISLGLTCETKGKNEQSVYEVFGVSHPIVPYITLRSPPRSAAKTIHELMLAKPPHYQLYLNEIYFKSSKETQDEVKKLLVDFDFSDVLYYVIESRDLQTIKHVVEEFNIDLTKYRDAINECPAMEDCIEISDYINNLLDKDENDACQ